MCHQPAMHRQVKLLLHHQSIAGRFRSSGCVQVVALKWLVKRCSALNAALVCKNLKLATIPMVALAAMGFLILKIVKNGIEHVTQNCECCAWAT